MAKRSRASEDMISDLPDDILCQILSFLPSYYSIKTSLLSTRFRNLWQSIPILDLTDKQCPINFEKLMEKALSSHEFLSELRKFRLRCTCFWYSNNTISKWIQSATVNPFNLEELDIKVRSINRVELPSTLFSCRRLKTLRLEGGIILSNIPADTCFPYLKTFNFISITISMVAENLSNSLLSAVCPVLENFLVQDCSLKIILSDIIINPYLEYLGGLQGNLDSASFNVKVLKQLELHDTSVNPFAACHICSLAWILRPFFPHLTHLVVKVHHLYPSSDLRVLLEHSPNLISLVLEKAESDKVYSWANPSPPTMISQSSFCKNLVTVQINDFIGFQELKLVEYFLKNAMVLKNLVLCVARAVRLSNEIKASILHEIRVMSQCEVEFRD